MRCVRLGRACLGWACVVFAQPIGECGRRGPDDGAVHPVRSRTDRAAQPGGSEVQPVSETITQFRLGVGFPQEDLPEEIAQLRLVARFGIVRDPSLRRCLEICYPEVRGPHSSPP
jgi:hypothetical protein